MSTAWRRRLATLTTALLLAVTVGVPQAPLAGADEPSCRELAGLVPDSEGNPYPYPVYGSGHDDYWAFAREPLVLAAFTYTTGTYDPAGVVIDWGDGTTSTASSVIDCNPYIIGGGNQHGNFFYGRHTYENAGTYRATFSAFTGRTTFDVRERTPEPPDPDPVGHYRVELRSWIPQPAVVDPFHPVPYRFYTPDVPQGCRPAGWTDVTVSSVFLGDNHTRYDGTVRYAVTLEFDWDGTAITGLTHTGTPGDSKRRWTVKNNKTGATTSCDQTGAHVDSRPDVSATGNTFRVRYTHATNLVRPALPLEASLVGSIGADGTLRLTAHATAFPSAGYRITRNGSVLRTRVFRNASCKKGLGAEGLANLTTGLGPVGLLAPFDVTTVLRPDSGQSVVPCGPKTPFVAFRGGQFGGAGSSRGW